MVRPDKESSGIILSKTILPLEQTNDSSIKILLSILAESVIITILLLDLVRRHIFIEQYKFQSPNRNQYHQTLLITIICI